MDELIKDFEKEGMKKEIPAFQVGDTVRVLIRIIEAEKERVQAFQGTVIARKGKGLSETFSLHRVSYGEGMERVFFLHSPRIANIEVVKRGDVRRSKLYYLRGKKGKAAKVREKIGGGEQKAALLESEKSEEKGTEIERESVSAERVPEEASSQAASAQ
jgi:large subunit ribosomal protein L19